MTELLTFNEVPTHAVMMERARAVAKLAGNADAAMIGGAPYFMSYLEYALGVEQVKYVYAFTKRDVVETHKADGSVEKEAVFRHAGWVK